MTVRHLTAVPGMCGCGHRHTGPCTVPGCGCRAPHPPGSHAPGPDAQVVTDLAAVIRNALLDTSGSYVAAAVAALQWMQQAAERQP